MNEELKNLIISLGKTKHLLNEYCINSGGCYKCMFYKGHEKDNRVICCFNTSVSIEELESRIVKLLYEAQKDEN